MNMRRRTATTAVATVALLGMTATGALAHQCLVADRSAQGAIGAGRSGQWFTVSVADEFRSVFADDVGLADDTLAAAVDLAMVKAADAGIPTHIAVFGHHTLLAHRCTFDEPVSDAVAERLADDHGIDWLFEEGGIISTFGSIIGEVLDELG